MNTEDTYERIEKYLDGALSSEERKTFEDELKNKGFNEVAMGVSPEK